MAAQKPESVFLYNVHIVNRLIWLNLGAAVFVQLFTVGFEILPSIFMYLLHSADS